VPRGGGEVGGANPGDAPDTRTRLLQAAVAVINANGEQAVRVADIARQAGVTEPSLYHFFGSREGLIEAAHIDRYLTGQADIITGFTADVRRCRTREDFLGCVDVLLGAVFSDRRRQARFTRVSVLGSAHSRPSLARTVAAVQRQGNELLAEPFRHAQSQGWIGPDLDCEVLAVWCIGMVTGRVFIEIDPELATSPAWDEYARVAVRAVLGPGEDPAPES
jgi:AcrR family transcriptional regulator